ncbi:RTA1 like protein-domain-containing protein, partial [Pyrenochaeta sp. MPI-SDFR-AT-0127]
FTVIFGTSLVGFLVVFAIHHLALAFTISLSIGILCEIAGYVSRTLSWKDHWLETSFLEPIIILTITPAFIAGKLQFCLKRIVYIHGEGSTRIKVHLYPFIIIVRPGCFYSPGVGDGMAAVVLHSADPLNTGNFIIAGLMFHVVTVTVYLAYSVDFWIRVYQCIKAAGAAASLNQDPRVVEIQNSNMFKDTLAVLTLSSPTVAWRSIYRVVELLGGWASEMMRHQGQFLCMQSTMIAISSIAQNILHLSRGLYEIAGSRVLEEKRIRAESTS